MIDSIRTAKESFKILCRNPVIALPYLLSTFIGTLGALLITDIPDAADLSQMLSQYSFYIVSALAVMIISGLVSVFSSIIAIKLAYDSVKSKSSFSAAVSFAPSRFLPYLFTSIAVGILVLAALLPLAIPLLIFAVSGSSAIQTIATILVAAGFFVSLILVILMVVRLAFAQYYIVLEKRGIADSIKASWRIARSNVLNLLLLLFIIFVPMVMALLLVDAGAELAAGTNYDIPPPPSEGAAFDLAEYVPTVVTDIFSAWITVALLMAFLELRKEKPELQKRKK
ncbi:MAG: glycerophosphoryl diester phosphodiesterase membrane domain-containing protein [Candidatus Aenigmarchaeota archaeon]|nr:glycerophosphoryl diester phosphodiesterase membrane domain-containing protein [Candidatus Aenigmarchaeota archaeon]